MSSRAAAVACAALISAVFSAPSEAQRERVEVARLLIDVRVRDTSGHAVPTLRAGDFAVAIDGRPARIDRADFARTYETRSNAPASSRVPRLVVFFVQRTLDANVARRERDVIALSAALRRLTPPVLAQLDLSDQVAVVSFDLHLTVWSDFTNDLNRVGRILQHDVLTERAGLVVPGHTVSLLSGSFLHRAERTYRIADALTRLGAALQPLPGSKTVVLLGYGFGKPDAFKRSLVEAAALPGVHDEGYRDAIRSLVRARAAVLAVDVTAADRHALEIGLEGLAGDTGGVFTKTYPSDERATRDVVQALGGYYTLSVERPSARRGASRRIRVSLPGRSYRVHAPTVYVE